MPERYDFIIFTADESENLVIKQIWGLPGDVLKVARNGGLFINGVEALTPYDRPYRLNRFYQKKLKVFEGALDGYLALGHPGSLDSGRIGPVQMKDILGTVSKDEGRKQRGAEKP